MTGPAEPPRDRTTLDAGEAGDGRPRDRATVDAGEAQGRPRDRVTLDAGGHDGGRRRDRTTVDADAGGAGRRRDRTTVDASPAGHDRPPPGAAGSARTFPSGIAERLRNAELYRPDDLGGQAVLYRGAWDDGRDVIVKIYHRARPGIEEVWARWERAGGQHLVPFVLGRTAWDQDYEVSVFLPEGSLADLLRREGRLDPDRARDVLAQVAAALDFIHRAPDGRERSVDALVHSDIKPSNIMVERTGPISVKLADFGIARILTQTLEQAAGAMTPEYAAPELFRDSRSAAIDWWALGMTMLELLQGHHPLRPNGEQLDPFRINGLVNNEPVPIDGDVPARWQTLLRGLLTWSPARRWGYAEVRRWLDGVDSEVDQSIGPPAGGGPAARVVSGSADGAAHPSVPAFPFAGTQVRHPRELAALFAANWRQAGHLVAGVGWYQMLEWSEAISPHLSAALRDVHLRHVLPRSPVDRTIAEIIVRLDPEAPPTFRGYRADPQGVVGLLTAAEAGIDDHAPELPGLDRDVGDVTAEEAAEALAAVESLRASGALRVLDRLPGGSGLAAVDDRWQRWYRRARAIAVQALGEFERLPNRRLLLPVLLRAALDPVARAELAHRVRAAVTREARRAGWVRRLTRRTGGPDGPAAQAVLLLWAHRAEIRQVVRAEPHAGFAGHVQRLRAQVDAQILAAGPPRAPGHWLPDESRRPATRAPRPRRTGGVPAAWFAAVTGYVVLVTIAGTGVALGTSVGQGLLTAGALLLVGLCLCAGLRLPRSALSGALLGAFGGAVAGLAVSALPGAVAGMTLGPVVGWPVFWGSWVLIVLVAAARGAFDEQAP
ncbi:serine/threonine-protein kinase [Micromonospora sp. BL1]|nr:serine/threonine-protein kinase [Micromonospora sp. BL1]